MGAGPGPGSLASALGISSTCRRARLRTVCGARAKALGPDADDAGGSSIASTGTDCPYCFERIRKGNEETHFLKGSCPKSRGLPIMELRRRAAEVLQGKSKPAPDDAPTEAKPTSRRRPAEGRRTVALRGSRDGSGSGSDEGEGGAPQGPPAKSALPGARPSVARSAAVLQSPLRGNPFALPGPNGAAGSAAGAGSGVGAAGVDGPGGPGQAAGGHVSLSTRGLPPGDAAGSSVSLPLASGPVPVGLLSARQVPPGASFAAAGPPAPAPSEPAGALPQASASLPDDVPPGSSTNHLNPSWNSFGQAPLHPTASNGTGTDSSVWAGAPGQAGPAFPAAGGWSPGAAAPSPSAGARTNGAVRAGSYPGPRAPGGTFTKPPPRADTQPSQPARQSLPPPPPSPSPRSLPPPPVSNGPDLDAVWMQRKAYAADLARREQEQANGVSPPYQSNGRFPQQAAVGSNGHPYGTPQQAQQAQPGPSSNGNGHVQHQAQPGPYPGPQVEAEGAPHQSNGGGPEEGYVEDAPPGPPARPAPAPWARVDDGLSSRAVAQQGPSAYSTMGEQRVWDMAQQVRREAKAKQYSLPAFKPLRRNPGFSEEDPYFTSLTPAALHWLRNVRHLTDDVIRKNRLYCCEYGVKVRDPATGQQVHREVEALAFPFFRRGRMVFVKYRLYDPAAEQPFAVKQFRSSFGAEPCMYGLDEALGAVAAGQRTLVVVEGEMDKLALNVAGFWNVVSVPNGAPPARPGASRLQQAFSRPGAPPSEEGERYRQHYAYLDSFVGLLGHDLAGFHFLLATDADAAGQALRGELLRRLGRERCWEVRSWDNEELNLRAMDADVAAAEGGRLPGYRKDANDVLIHDGPTALYERLSAAKAARVVGLVETSEYEEQLLALYRTSGSEAMGVPTGWPCLDPYYKVAPGEVTIVTGVPNSGKSEWLDALVVNLAEDRGWAFALCSLEKGPAAHLRALIEKRMRQPFRDTIHNNVRRPGMPLEAVVAGFNWVLDHFHLIRYEEEDESGSPTIDWVLSKARVAVMRHGIRGLVIDPYNELDSRRGRDESETDHIKDMLSKVRRFARQAEVHVWFVAHPRMQRAYGGEAPSMYDISGSAHWFNKTDNGIVVNRRFVTATEPDGKTVRKALPEVEIRVSKVRNKEVGQQGMATLLYDRPTGRYGDPAGPPASGQLLPSQVRDGHFGFAVLPPPDQPIDVAAQPVPPRVSGNGNGQLPAISSASNSAPPPPPPSTVAPPPPAPSHPVPPAVKPRPAIDISPNAVTIGKGKKPAAGKAGPKAKDASTTPKAKGTSSRASSTGRAGTASSASPKPAKGKGKKNAEPSNPAGLPQDVWEALPAEAALEGAAKAAAAARGGNGAEFWHLQEGVSGSEDEGEDGGGGVGRSAVDAVNSSAGRGILVEGPDGTLVPKESEAPSSLAQGLAEMEGGMGMR